MRNWLIELLGGIAGRQLLTRCESFGCCMVWGHGGPHREFNGLAFSTNQRKRNAAGPRGSVVSADALLIPAAVESGEVAE
jgi:hypothetical protein